MLLLAFVAAASVQAAPRAVVSAAPPPVLMMVRAAATPANERREQKLFDELTLALDGFMVMGVPAPAPGFAALPLDEQIGQVLPEARANDAMAVVWMSFPLSKQVMVHLVALGSGRAFVRTIEADKSSASESSLALIARELLGTAYLFEPPASVPAEVKRVVSDVKKQIAAVVVEPAPEPAPPPPPEVHPWELWLSAALRYPLAGGADAVPFFSAGFGLARALPQGFVAALDATAGFAQVARPGTAGAQYVVAGPSLSLYRGFSVGALSLGPRALAGADFGAFIVPGQTLAVALPRFALGLHGRSEVRGFAVRAGLDVVWAPLGAELRAADSTVLFRTPSWGLDLGLAFGWEGL